tara:strand:- start:7 stop:318 length:312 start_codon:yes stop_codon:yes gene_type:complete
LVGTSGCRPEDITETEIGNYLFARFQFVSDYDVHVDETIVLLRDKDSSREVARITDMNSVQPACSYWTGGNGPQGIQFEHLQHILDYMDSQRDWEQERKEFVE